MTACAYCNFLTLIPLSFHPLHCHAQGNMKKRLQVGSATGVPKNTPTYLKKKHFTQLRPRRILSLPGLTRLQTSPNLCTILLSSRKVFQTGLSINYLRILDSPVRSVHTINFFKIYKTEALITSHRNNGG